MLGDFSYSNPTKLYFGEHSLEGLRKELPAYGKNVLLVYGGGSIRKNGIYDRVVVILKACGKEIVEDGGVMPNPTVEKLYEGCRRAREGKVELILAVGGGSVCDYAKAVSVSAYCEEDPWEKYYLRMEDADNKIIPVGCVLTMVGTGSEMNGGSVITHHGQKRKIGHVFGDNVFPKFSILNPVFTFTLPKYQMTAGFFDIMSHILEQYFSGEDDNTSDYIMEGLERMEAYMRELGLGMSVRELGVTEDMLDGIADGSFLMEGGYKTLTHEEIVGILKESMRARTCPGASPSGSRGVLFDTDEHAAKGGKQEKTAYECGPSGQQLRTPDPQRSAQDEEENDAIVLKGLTERPTVPGVKAVEEQGGAAAEIAGTHGGGDGVASDLPEALHLHGADERNGHIDGRVPPARRDISHHQQDEKFRGDDELPPVDGRPGAEVGPDHVGDHDAGGKGQNGDEIVEQHFIVSLRQAEPQQNDVAGLGVGKDAAPGEIGIGVQKTAHDREQGAQAEGLGHLTLFLMHGIAS